MPLTSEELGRLYCRHRHEWRRIVLYHNQIDDPDDLLHNAMLVTLQAINAGRLHTVGQIRARLVWAAKARWAQHGWLTHNADQQTESWPQGAQADCDPVFAHNPTRAIETVIDTPTLLASLTPEERRYLTEAHLGYTLAEIAVRHQRSLGFICWCVWTARRRLRAQWGPDFHLRERRSHAPDQ